MASDDLREQRRFRRLRAAAVTALIVLTVAAVTAAVIAVVQRQEAIRQRDRAIAQLLRSESNDMLAGSNSGGDARAFQEVLAARALAAEPDDATLLHALDARTNTIKIVDTGAKLTGVAVSPDGHRLASAQVDHTLRLRDADTGQLIGGALTGHTTTVTSVAFSSDGHRLVSAARTGPCGCGTPTPGKRSVRR
ncbi:MAG: WD40 repeat domain-containing protein [Mycobacterium sp.]